MDVTAVDPKTVEAARTAWYAVYSSLITALFTVVVAAVNYLATRANQRQLEEVKATLGQRGKERDAARDYEYSARKRLYTESEPVVFRFVENCASAQARIERLATFCREGEDALAQWLRDDENRLSTLYRLAAPLADFALMRDTLTSFDLSLEPRIYGHYALGRLLYESFSDDHALARAEPALRYLPGQLDHVAVKPDPAVYTPQGITAETADLLCRALTDMDQQTPRTLAFHRFRDAARVAGPARDVVLKLDYLFRDFRPRSRPVLWRLLLVQRALYVRLNPSHDFFDRDAAGAFHVGMAPALLETGDRAFDEAAQGACDAFLRPRLDRIFASMVSMSRNRRVHGGQLS